MNQRSLIVVIAAGGLAVLLVVVNIWLYWPASGLQSAETLADLALTAEEAAERERAAVQLARAEEGAAEQLQRVLAESDDPKVRAAAVQGLGGLWDYDAMPALLDALEDESALVRARAFAAIQRLLGLTQLRYNPKREPKKQSAEIKAIHTKWEKLRESPMLDEWKERNRTER